MALTAGRSCDCDYMGREYVFHLPPVVNLPSHDPRSLDHDRPLCHIQNVCMFKTYVTSGKATCLPRESGSSGSMISAFVSLPQIKASP